MQVRRSVLGDEHVDRVLANQSEFDAPFQRFITEMAWGTLWARPELDRRTRSLVTVAILAALGRREELELHLRATRNTGASPTEAAVMSNHAAGVVVGKIGTATVTPDELLSSFSNDR